MWLHYHLLQVPKPVCNPWTSSNLADETISLAVVMLLPPTPDTTLRTRHRSLHTVLKHPEGR